MEIELYMGLSLFALATTITPGPNTLMLMSSGANYGLHRSTPHILGVVSGFSLMIMLVGIGLAGLFETYPFAYLVLQTASIAYLLYLAYRIACAGSPFEKNAEGGKPLTALEAALFQWINPKSWSMALTAITVYSPNQSLDTIILTAVIFGLIALPAVSVWAWMGQNLTRILRSPAHMQTFNIVMAFLLVASLYPVLTE